MFLISAPGNGEEPKKWGRAKIPPQTSTHIRHVKFYILMIGLKSLVGSGSLGRARTADLMINSHPLYRLSYQGMRRNLKTIPRDRQAFSNIFFTGGKNVVIC